MIALAFDALSDGKKLRDSVWEELCLAAGTREHGWRTPVVASIDSQGLPDARTVVLRRVNLARRTISFFTDKRSPKVAQLREMPRTTIVFWCQKLSWQLRVAGKAMVVESGPEVDEVWQQVAQTAAAGDYLAPQAPGSLMDGALAIAGEGSHQLAIVTVCVDAIDWLELSVEGHRRALIREQDVEWLVP